MARLTEFIPEIDNRALDAARCYFGVETPTAEIYEGEMLLTDYLDQHPVTDDAHVIQSPSTEEIIPEGRRNSTMSRFALSMLTKYGDANDTARRAFEHKANDCRPLLDPRELSTIWKSAVKKYRTDIKTSPEYDPRDNLTYETASSIRDGLKYMPEEYTDLGQSKIFAEVYGDICRYSTQTQWLGYGRGKWNEDNAYALRWSQELTDLQLDEARAILDEARQEEDAAVVKRDKEAVARARLKIKEAQKYRDYVLKRQDSHKLGATLTQAAPLLTFDINKLDADPFLINTPDGTVDLRTAGIKDFDNKDFITKMTAVGPSKEGEEEWLSFVERIACGDRELVDFLQLCSGMTLVGKVYSENLLIAYGTGGNGKSTFFNALFSVLGEYSGSLSSESLTAGCRRNRQPELAELRGKRLVIAAELEEGTRLDTAILKRLCSTDPILAERKFKDPFYFSPSHTLILYTNHLPKVGTTDIGTWDRLIVIPFLARFRGESGEVKNYADYLVRNCGGAILQWAIEGARKFIEADYFVEVPAIVRDAIAEYREENDWLTEFLREKCELHTGYQVRAGNLYEAYRDHCGKVGEYLRSQADFKTALTAVGFSWKRTNKGAYYFGVRLKPEPQNDLGFTQSDGNTPFG